MAKTAWREARARWRLARGVPGLGRRVAWTSLKLLGALALSEGVKRVRAGPLGVSVSAPASAVEGDAFLVEARVEAPFPLVDLAAYFGEGWQSAPSAGDGSGVRRERWLFQTTAPGLRPVVVRARDAEGHSLARTRWVLVLPRSVASWRSTRRLKAVGRGPDRVTPLDRET